MSKKKQLTSKEIGVINLKGEIANELQTAWDKFYRLHSRCLYSDDRELKSIAVDLSKLVDFINLTEKEVNIRPVNLSNTTT